ncbi:uncharacterized protein LOC111921300 [Lactuca sativa]|uniref:uncharacterized protein LOC111921300 n=1 Tax=Lactuca sativa TaxID=4236 RepID=UPI000CD9F36C|nr:uncharacterized protein LOC111921300 [Lactuca sativa]
MELRKWITKTYNVELPYLKVFRGKEQAYIDMYGKWEESFMKLDEFREELLNRNEGSIVEIDIDISGDKKRFKRFFVCLAACSKGFLGGCRPYIALDACHLKGKFTGVLAAATGIDGNNSIFPIAYSVLESESTQSWTWFLESLKKAIGMPDGLVISSDMKKGLEVAVMHIYPNVEHRECVRHLYSNFKKQFRESFNSWIGATRYQPLLDLLDAIREKLMKWFDKKRMLVKRWNGVLVPNAKIRLNDISKNLGEYEVCRSGDNQVDVKFKGSRWEVNLDKRKCGCRVWQVTGVPCVHEAAFIAFTRDANWDQYVDQYFSIEKFKEAYAFKIASMPRKDQWIKKDGDKIYPPLMKRPPGRPKKIELNPRMSLKEGTSVRDVVSMDTVKRLAKIRHLKVLIQVKHPRLQGNVERKQNLPVAREFQVHMKKIDDNSWSF